MGRKGNVMKIEVVVNEELKFVDKSFEGLATDLEDEVCLLTDEHIVYFGVTTKGGSFAVLKSEKFVDYGPFTQFNGTVTLEND